jgi:hypothetical protein
MRIAWLTRRKNRRPFASSSYQPSLECLESRETPSTLTIGATRDNSIFSENNNSDGASYDLYTGRTNQSGGAYRRSLIYFDLSGLPVGAVINSVSLTMRMSGGSPSGLGPGGDHPQGYTGAINVSLDRLLADWGAGNSGAGMGNGGTSMAGAGGASPGFAPAPGDATWNYSFWNTTTWTTPGGDYVATPSATQGVNINPQFVTWSSPGLVNDVQGWADDPATNFGWEIIGDESTNGTSRRFVSMDAPNASYQPVLTINYTVPQAVAGPPAGYAIAEGDSLTLNASLSPTAPGATPTYTWDINGDGIFGDAVGPNPTLTWAQLQAIGIDDGPRTFNVAVQASDGLGNTFDSTSLLTLNNTAPTATALNFTGSTQEGGTLIASLVGAFDPSNTDTAAGFHYSFALSPSSLATSYAAASSSSSANYVFPDNGTYTVFGRIFDKDGGFNNYSSNVTITNVPPTATFSGGPTSFDQAPATVNVSFSGASDPSSVDTGAGFHYSIALSQDGLATTYAAASTTPSGSFTLSENGTYTVFGRIFDKDDGFTDYTMTVTVGTSSPPASPVPPTAPLSTPSTSPAQTLPEVISTPAGMAAVLTVTNPSTGAVEFSITPFGPGFTGGLSVTTGDVTGDGTPDIIVGAGPGGLPQVNVYDGKTGQLIWAFFPFVPSFRGGVTVAAGDLSGDGVADVVVGAGPGGSPQVTVYSGKTHAAIENFFAFAPSFHGGVSVAVGDVRGIGRADIIAGAGAGGGPEVSIFDGLTAAPLASYYAFTPTFRGGVNVAAGDLTGDGIADIVAGAGPGGGPEVTVFDLPSGNVLANFFAYSTAYKGGVRVAASLRNGTTAIHVSSASPGQLDEFFAYDPSAANGVQLVS